MGSNPVGVIGGLAQLGERLPYKQRVTGSSPVTSIFLLVPWCRGYHACLSRRRSPVQIRLGPLIKTDSKKVCHCFVGKLFSCAHFLGLIEIKPQDTPAPAV